MAIPAIVYEIPMGQVRAEIEAEQRRIERGLNGAVDDLLTFAGLVQAEGYLSTSMPALPPGSTYERTFTLREASKARRTGTRLPDISGEWYIDEGIAPYGEGVIGPRAKQKSIHKGRWKSQEDIEAAVKAKAPEIIGEHLRK